jgi:hypothetical protein
MAHISDMEKQMADMTENVRRMQVEIEAAKAAAAAKTEIEHFIASEPMPTAKRKAAPPPHPAGPPPPELVKEKKSKKSQIIDVPPCIMPARPKYGQLPTPEQPKPDRALDYVLALKPAPVPGAKRVGVINPMEVETDGVENSNPSTSLLAPNRATREQV